MKTLRLDLDDLLVELRRRHWTLIRWGQPDAPQLIAATYQWPTYGDALILRDQDHATAYRTPSTNGDGLFNPRWVVYQYHATALWTLRAILALPTPGTPGAPTRLERPADACLLPERLRTPTLIRPLASHT